jgi:uncharacterized BrkB/YihY/UPF0761 family membrane protein
VWAHIGRGGLFVFWVLRRLRKASVGRMAASLAFTTLLGIVPLFTVAWRSSRDFRCSTVGSTRWSRSW